MTRPSPVILASIILSFLLAMFALVWGFVRSGGDSGKPQGTPLPESLSYAKPSPQNRFIYVAFGSLEAEAKLTGEAKRKSDDVRSTYAKPGLYDPAKPNEPIWTLEGYAPDENIYLSLDGDYLVRLEGEWWKTKAYPAGTRLAADVEQAQLDAPAVSFYKQGKLLHQYALREIITQPDNITHSPAHILWPGGAVLNEAEGKFILFTQDSRRNIFDFRTGAVISQEGIGLDSKFSQIVVTSVVGLMALVALLWAYFALIRKPKQRV